MFEHKGLKNLNLNIFHIYLTGQGGGGSVFRVYVAPKLLNVYLFEWRQ